MGGVHTGLGAPGSGPGNAGSSGGGARGAVQEEREGRGTGCPGSHSPIAPRRRPSGSRRSPRVAGFRPSGGDPKTHWFKAAATTSSSRGAPRGPPPRLPRPRSLQPLANHRGVLRSSHPLCLLRPIRAPLPRKPRPVPPPLRAPLSSSGADAAQRALGSRRGVLGGGLRACAQAALPAEGATPRGAGAAGLGAPGAATRLPGGRPSKPPLVGPPVSVVSPVARG